MEELQPKDYEQLLFEQIKELNRKLPNGATLQNSPLRAEQGERIAELEVKMAKLWALLVSNDNIKKEDRLTKQGKEFGSVLLKKS